MGSVVPQMAQTVLNVVKNIIRISRQKTKMVVKSGKGNPGGFIAVCSLENNTPYMMEYVDLMMERLAEVVADYYYD